MRHPAKDIFTIISFCLLILFCCFLFGCDSDDDPGSGQEQASDEEDDDSFDDDEADDDDFSYPYCEIDEAYIADLISTMPLKKKIAQMYLVGAQVYPWFDLGDAKRFIKEIGVGAVGVGPGSGIGLWPEWTVKCTNKIQTWAKQSENGIPVFIASDQEGGIPQAVSAPTGGTGQPGNIGLGATFDPEATYASYSIMGAQLWELGINNPFAPAVELSVSYQEVPMYMRSFGEQTEAVAMHAAQAVRGFQENLVAATAKHFPGQGTAEGDDHAGRIINYESEEHIRSNYFPPFQAAIDAGVDMIMINHVVYEALDAGVPVTFSHKIATDILRGELGFEGLILTDDMNMGAIMGEPLDEHPDVLAILAGADMILDGAGDGEPSFDMHPDNYKWAFDVAGQIDTIMKAVNNGVISEDRIDQSVRRILQTKMKYCLFETRQRNPETIALKIDTKDQIETSEDLFEQAITLVKNDGGLWPLDLNSGQKIHVVSIGPVQSEMYPDAFWGNISTTTLLWEIQKLYPDATGGIFDVMPGEIKITQLINKAAQADPDILIISSFNGYHYTEQRNLVNGLLSLGIPTILVATATPFDLMAFSDVDAYLALYSNRTIGLQIAAETIFGLRKPLGKLPVNLSEDYDYGYSAYQID